MIYDEKKKDNMVSFRVNIEMFNFLKSIPKRGMSKFLEASIRQSRRYGNYKKAQNDT